MTATCSNGHTFTGWRDPFKYGFLRCPVCHVEVWGAGALTDAERAQELADAEMVLAALAADGSLESELVGMTYEQQVAYVRTR